MLKLLTLILIIFCFSCAKSYMSVAGKQIDTTKIHIIRIDTTRVGPETFLEIYYRDKNDK
jgi:hypothetical protein